MDLWSRKLLTHFFRMKTLVTHNGAIHADDLFAAATLSLYLDSKGETHKIVRSRDKETIDGADYVFDVGGVYDPSLNRFDHHQKNGPGARDNTVPYASFGLIWKHFGPSLCDGDNELWKKIDTEIVSPIDAADNGVDVSMPKIKGVSEYVAARTFLIFTPTWQEQKSSIDDVFNNQVIEAKRVLRREIEVSRADIVGRKIIMDAYDKSEDKRIIELPDNFPRYLYQNTLSSLSEPVYMICKSRFTDDWKIEAISKNPNTMQSRKPFPVAWRGLPNGDSGLKKLTGVEDVIFCHHDGFLMSTGTRESAYKLVEISLNNKEKTKWLSWMK